MNLGAAPLGTMKARGSRPTISMIAKLLRARPGYKKNVTLHPTGNCRLQKCHPTQRGSSQKFIEEGFATAAFGVPRSAKGRWPALFGLLLVMAAAASARARKAAPTFPSFISPAAKQKLDLCIHALGGRAFTQWKSLQTTGRVFLIQDNSTAGFAPYKSLEVPPDKRRFTYGSGAPVTLINDGKHGWEIDRYGVIQQTPQQIQAWKSANRYSFENILRLRIREPGILIEDKGLTLVDNQPVVEIEIIDSRHVQIKVYLDEDSSLPREIRYRLQNPRTQQWQEYSDAYSDYQRVQGIETPMHITRYQDGERVAELFRNKARYDVSIPPGFFNPPR